MNDPYPMDQAPPERQPPVNHEIEQALLGAILSDNAAYDRVVDIVRTEHFADDLHGRIFDAMAKLIETGKTASVLTLRSTFESEWPRPDMTGAQYLAELYNAGGGMAGQAGHYGETLRDLWHRREAILGLRDTIDDLHVIDLERPAEKIIEQTQSSLDGVLSAGQSGGLELLEQRVEGALAQVQDAFKAQGTGAAGLGTGLPSLDRLIGGLKPGKVYVLAGRPSMGKTSLAENISFGAAAAGQRPAFFSLETTTEDVIQRQISRLTGIDSNKINNGWLDEAEMDQVIACRDALNGLPLHVDDSSTIGVPGIRARARRMQRAGGLDLVVIDYLQLMGAEKTGGWVNRTEEIGRMTRGIKTGIAKDLKVPVILLSQLSRETEKREDKRPQLSDLRDSGSIEQDADVVMFLYREEYYLRNEKPQRRGNEKDAAFEERERTWYARMERKRGTAEIIVAKQKNGPTGSVTVNFDGPRMRFHEDEGAEVPQEEIAF